MPQLRRHPSHRNQLRAGDPADRVLGRLTHVDEPNPLLRLDAPLHFALRDFERKWLHAKILS
jgi:hypothetical protein